MVAGLPAGAEPLHDALIEAIRPQVIIIADGERPAAARARPELEARLAHHRASVLYLRDTRAVTIEFRPGRWTLETMSGIRMSGSGRTRVGGERPSGP